MADSITVIVVEDQAGTREALCAALRLGGIKVLGAFGSGEEALAAAEGLRPDVALVDLGLPGMPGAELIRRLRLLQPSLHVLVLTVFHEERRIMEAIDAGAEGYLLKEATIDEVRRAIEQVREGLAPLSPEVARHVLNRLKRPATAERSAEQFGLSDRERQVLTLLARGHSYASVAKALALQLGTVQTHVKNIYRKLDVASKAEATGVAIRHKLVDPA